jgi:hypothetical protein
MHAVRTAALGPDRSPDRHREKPGQHHPEFAEGLRAARAAVIIGAEVFTGRLVIRMTPSL